MSNGPLGLSRLELLGTGRVSSDHLDVIARTGSEGEVVDSLAAWFRAHPDTLHLDHVRTPGSLSECLASRLAESGWRIGNQVNGVCPFIRLSGHTWDTLLATFGASHRANVRRRIRALSGYGMTFELVTDEERRRAVFPELVSLHNQRWGERGGTAFHDEASRDFHDEATRLLLERGWLRLYVLTLNGATAAVQYLLAYKGRVYFYQHGYDARYSSQSVGLVSFALAIRSALEEGASEFDMLWGDESYKHLWAHDSRSLVRLDLFPPDVGGRFHRRTSEANRALRSLAKRLLRGQEKPVA
jgi:CelD/BcsL family acetyltransferase involved in cellulose biosynthesis